MSVKRPRGTSDVLPGTVERWAQLENVIRDTFRVYHFSEIRTPIFENTEVFQRGVGETTDIVQREMYTFLDRGERSITLRPEGTAGVVRAYVENKLYGQPGVSKLFYVGPMFRYEKPQLGRERQFHQYGCEVLGSDGPEIDAEVIALNVDILERMGIQKCMVELNSVGCPECRPRHRDTMLGALRPVAHELCSDCQSRLEKNPLRIFDCKNESCQSLLKQVQAPTIIEALCDDCSSHFEAVKTTLDGFGVRYVINDHLVRGLDYYTRTAWEITVEGFGTVAGGGRYNGLVRELGGPETPGIGFAGGMERALMVLAGQGVSIGDALRLDVFVAVADTGATTEASQLLQLLRGRGIVADRDYQGRGLKAQFKQADREGARLVAILGSDEVARGVVTLKDLGSGNQQELPQSEAVDYMTKTVSEDGR